MLITEEELIYNTLGKKKYIFELGSDDELPFEQVFEKV